MFADTHRYSLMGYWNDCKRKNNAKKYRTRDLPRRHGDTECHRGSSLCPFVPSCLCGTLSKKYRIRDLPRRHGDTECHGEGSSLCPFVPRCLCGTFPKKYRTRDLPRRHGDTECHGQESSLCPFVPPCLCGTLSKKYHGGTETRSVTVRNHLCAPSCLRVSVVLSLRNTE